MGNIVTIADGRKFELPWLHYGVMGEPGSGKSRLMASMPKPLIVLASDPVSKLQPYFDEGVVETVTQPGPFGQTIHLVRNTAGELIIQVEGFYDTDVTMLTSAMTGFVGRMSALVQEVRAGKWKSAGIDSWSGFEDAASDRRKIGPMACKQGGAFAAHRNEAKEDLRQIFRMQLIHLPCNMGIAFHTTTRQKEQGGETLYTMKCIGDFESTVGQNLAERYHSVALPDGITRQLYTKPDGRFKLATLIDAPSPCQNNFAALFGPMLARKIAEDDARKASATKA